MKIFIVDQHKIVIDGLIALLSKKKGFDVVGFANTAEDAFDWLKTNKADLIITEIVFPNDFSAELINIIKIHQQDAKILILTGENRIKKVSELFRLGINGFIEKQKNTDYIFEAIRCIQNGESYIGNDLRQKIIDNFSNTHTDKEDKNIREILESITNRELEVIQLICEGCNSKEISSKLFISFNTVETHRKHIFQKLNIKNAIGLMRFALKHDLIE